EPARRLAPRVTARWPRPAGGKAVGPGPVTCWVSAAAGNAPRRGRHPAAPRPIRPSGRVPVVPPGPQVVRLHRQVGVLHSAGLPEPAPPAAPGHAPAAGGDRRIAPRRAAPAFPAASPPRASP